MINDVIFTKDGRSLISASVDKTVMVWDVATGGIRRIIRGKIGEGPEGKIYAAALSPDNEWLAVGGMFHKCVPTRSVGTRKFDVPARNILPVAVAMRNIRFESGSAQLTPGSSRQLKEVAGMMSKHPDMKLVIEGHTDDLPVTGPLLISPGVFCTDNQCLSEKRAESVRRYLVHNGVLAARLAVEGYGDARPYDPSDRDKNRRVQFRMK